MRINILLGGIVVGFLSVDYSDTNLRLVEPWPEPSTYTKVRRPYVPPLPYLLRPLTLLARRCHVPLRIGSLVARLRWKRRRWVQSLRSS